MKTVVHSDILFLYSLNYPHRNRVNDEILRENIGIAKRLETVKPKYRIDKWVCSFVAVILRMAKFATCMVPPAKTCSMR